MEQGEKRKKKRKRMTGKMQATLWVVFCLFLVGILVIMIRVVLVGCNTSYAKASLSQKTGTDTVLQYKRGDILDRNGTVLAKSEKVYHLILDSRLILNNEESIEPTIRALCSVYGYEEAELRAVLEERKNSAYYRLRKYMTYEEKMLFEEYEKNLPKEADGSENKDKGKILGVTFEEEYLRTYPFGTLASHVLGFAKADGDGTYGRVYDYYDADLNVQQETVPAQDGQITLEGISG